MSTAGDNNKKDDIPDICANCGKGEEGANSLKACTACKLVKYCNRECQIAHRSQHKRSVRSVLPSCMKKHYLNNLLLRKTVQFVSCICPILVWVGDIIHAAGKRYAMVVPMHLCMMTKAI